jgi:hypothetical protein
MKNYKALRILGFICLGIVFVIGLGFITMSLWNWLVPVLFLGPVINFYQAIGLLVLSKILFGGFKGGMGRCGGRYPRHEYWRKRMEERMSNMTEEEKEKYRNRCNWANH